MAPADPRETDGGARASRVRVRLVDQPAALWWSLLYFFSLLCGYYVLRPVRDAMGSSGDALTVFPRAWVAWATARGWDITDFTLQILFTGTFLCMLMLQPLYGALVARFPRRVFLPVVYLVFIACLLTFFVAFHQGWPGRGVAFFVWTAVFNLFAVSVFWSFMADVFDDAHAKQVYGYIGAGGTLGALVGPAITLRLAERIGVGDLLLVSAAFLCVCLLCILKLRPWAILRERVRGEASGEDAMGGSIWAGLRLVAREPLLRALAILMFFGVGVGTLLYNEQAAITRHAFTDDAARTVFYANIDLAINGLAIVIQLFATRWLLRTHGVAPALLIPAFAVLAGFCVLAASPFPLMVAIVQVVTRAGEFSLGKPARETIYTRVPREWRYKGKAVIDTFVYRGSDLSFAWVHKGLSLFGSHIVFLGGVGIAGAMTFGAWRVIRAQRTLPADAPAAASGSTVGDSAA
jgi:AAA family ATP:ADP antiporter